MLRSILLIAMAMFSAGGHAQPYPNKPVRLITSFSAGGSQDLIARLLAQKVGESTGSRVVVDNKPGAGGLIATQEALRAAPDGYTIFMSSGAQIAIEPVINPKATYDPLKDFVHIVHVADSPLVLVATPSLPAKTLKELIALSQANKGTINTASTGLGSYTHMALEQLKAASGANLVHVPYKGAAQALNDVTAGLVQTMFTSPASAQPHTSTQRLRALAVTSSKRAAMLPDVPTFAEAGVPLEVSAWIGIAAPAGTPPAVVDKLNAEFNKAIANPEIKAKLISYGLDPVGGSADAFTQFVRKDIDHWANLIRSANIRLN